MGTYYNVDKTSNLDIHGSVLRSWVKNHPSITSINVKDDIPQVQNLIEVFSFHNNLKTINITGLHMEKVKDLSGTFLEIPNLTTIFITNYLENVTSATSVCNNSRNLTTFPNFVYSRNLEDFSGAFENCYSLPNVNSYYVGRINQYCNNITRLSRTFANCRNLSNLFLTYWNASKIYTMYSLCSYCYNLKAINMANSNFINLQNMMNMCYECRNLTTFNMANCNFGSNLVTTSDIFWWCTNLTTVTLSPMSVNNTEGMFGHCNNLISLNLTNLNTQNCKDMSQMFSRCSNLSSLTVGNNFISNNVINTAYMFESCNNISIWPSELMKAAPNSQHMYANCRKLSGGITGYNLSRLQNGDHMFYNTDIWSYSGSYGDNTTNISYMFSKCYNLLTANIYYWTPSSLMATISMFSECYKLYNVNMSKFSCPNTINLYGMFAYCNNLSTLLTGQAYFNGAMYIQRMFYNCQKLTGPTIFSDANFANAMYSDYMFYNCRNLTNLNCGRWNLCNLMYANNMFYNCINLTNINTTGWNLANLAYCSGMFGNCNKLSNYAVDNIARALLNAPNVYYKNLNGSNSYSPFYGSNTTVHITNMNSTLLLQLAQNGWGT